MDRQPDPGRFAPAPAGRSGRPLSLLEAFRASLTYWPYLTPEEARKSGIVWAGLFASSWLVLFLLFISRGF